MGRLLLSCLPISKYCFMEELYSLFASELTRKLPSLNPVGVAPRTRGLSGSQPSQNKLQLNRFPIIIDLDYYRNSHSSDNPAGDYHAAYRFYELSDEASRLTTFFEGVHSVSSVWGGIINSAVSDNGYVCNLLTQAKDSFRLSRMYGMGGVPEDWYQVNAQPSNWYDLVLDSDNLTRIEIDPHNLEVTLRWDMDDNREQSLGSGSSIKRICMDVLNVEFVRPWLRRELFEAGWGIPGIDRGYFSTGNMNCNDGILPLIPQSMLVGTNLSIEGDFSENDLAVLADRSIGKLSIGPFAVSTCDTPVEVNGEQMQLKISSKTTQVVGYISYGVPLCPQI